MRVALVSNAQNSAVDQVLRDLRTGLEQVRPTWVVDLLRLDGPKIDFSLYDLVHTGYVGYLFNKAWAEECPVTTNVWHILPEKIHQIQAAIAQTGYSRIVVDDVTTLQMLGQSGFTNVSPIPMPFDQDLWSALEPPSDDFTVGCFGDNFPTKRFDILQKAAKAAGVRAYMLVLPVGRSVHVIEPLEDYYSQIHVHVHCSFVDTNSRPVLEALACGIPSVSTINDGLRRVSNGVNLQFFDGSVPGLVRALKLTKEHYEMFRGAVRETPFPPLSLIAEKYAYVFERAVEGEA